MKHLPRILFTGARGLLARTVIPSLIGNYEVRSTDKVNAPADIPGYRAADLMNFEEVLSLMEGVEAIVHFAVATNHGREDAAALERKGAIHPFDEGMLTVNVQGLFHVFEAARLAGVKKIIFASSLTVYYGNKGLPYYGEDMPLDPQNLYACTKVFGESLARQFARDYGMSILCLRIGQPYPTGLYLDDLWQANRRLRSGYVAVEDVAQAVQCALKADVKFGIYNLVSASDNPRFDISAARRELGYCPRAYFSETGRAFYEDGDFPVPQK